MPFGISSTNEEQVRVVITPLSANGKPAQVQGALEVTVVSGTATVVQDPAKPLEFVARSGDDPGDSQFLVKGDADLGDGVVEVSDVVDYVVSGAQAASLGFSSSVEPKV